MSRYSSKLANGSEALVPSSYELDSVYIKATNGNIYNITDMIAQIRVSESLYSTALQAEVNVLDSANLLEKVKCVSGERLTFIVKRSLMDGTLEKYKPIFRIAEIHSMAKLSPGTNTYVFRCISDHAFINQAKTISKPFNNVPGKLIKDICTDELKIDSKKLNISTETKQTITGVYPRMRPLYLINWLTKRSYDNGTPFFFYETLSDGIHFNSYENMINKEAHREYQHAPSMDTTIGSEENENKLANKVLKLSSEFNMSKYINMANGAYSSTLHTLDIASKTYNTKTYSYDGSQLKLNKEGVLTTQMELDDRAIKDYSESTNFYMSLNGSAITGGSNYHAPIDLDILHANAYIENMDTLEVTLEVYGDFQLSCGMTINLSVIVSIDNSEEERGRDKYLSGKYIVASIEHTFEEEYKMKLLCKKDSFIESLDKIDLPTSQNVTI